MVCLCKGKTNYTVMSTGGEREGGGYCLLRQEPYRLLTETIYITGGVVCDDSIALKMLHNERLIASLRMLVLSRRLVSFREVRVAALKTEMAQRSLSFRAMLALLSCAFCG